jgi:hypothetical protein
MEGGSEGSWLGGQWKEEEKVFGLVANGRRKRRFLAWWPMEGGREGSWLGGQWFFSTFLLLPLFPQAAQANEEPPSESSLDLNLTQHPRDEKLEPREVRVRLEVEPLRARYYRILPNSRTLVILLQVDPASSDEPEIICEGYYETEDTSIFAWSSIPGVGHYRWLRGPIRRLPPNNKANYLVRTVRRILDFLQL